MKIWMIRGSGMIIIDGWRGRQNLHAVNPDWTVMRLKACVPLWALREGKIPTIPLLYCNSRVDTISVRTKVSDLISSLFLEQSLQYKWFIVLVNTSQRHSLDTDLVVHYMSICPISRSFDPFSLSSSPFCWLPAEDKAGLLRSQTSGVEGS